MILQKLKRLIHLRYFVSFKIVNKVIVYEKENTKILIQNITDDEVY